MCDRGMGMGWGRDEGRRCGAWSGFNCADGLWSRCGGSFPNGYLAEAYTGAAAFQFGLRAADRPVEVIAAIIDAERPRPTHSTRLAMHYAGPSVVPEGLDFHSAPHRGAELAAGRMVPDGLNFAASREVPHGLELSGSRCAFVIGDLAAPSLVCDGGNKLTSGGAYGAGGCVATLSSCISGQDGKPCANYEGRDGKMVGGTCMWYPRA